MWKQLQKKYLGSNIPVINVHGVINSQCTQKVAKRLSKLDTSRAVALAVSVNSPGGLPVQSDIIANKIRDFATKKNLKVYTFAKDLAASGGYWVLCTGNQVYADKTSIVGSIGVVFPKYQLEGLLDLTSVQFKQMYSNKQSLHQMFSPFNKLKEKDREEILKLCSSTHTKFISHVKKSRGDKLKIDDNIFSGQVYNGEDGKQMGLVDGVGSMVEVLEKKYPGSHVQVQQQKSFANTLLAWM